MPGHSSEYHTDKTLARINFPVCPDLVSHTSQTENHLPCSSPSCVFCNRRVVNGFIRLGCDETRCCQDSGASFSFVHFFWTSKRNGPRSGEDKIIRHRAAIIISPHPNPLLEGEGIKIRKVFPIGRIN